MASGICKPSLNSDKVCYIQFCIDGMNPSCSPPTDMGKIAMQTGLSPLMLQLIEEMQNFESKFVLWNMKWSFTACSGHSL